MIVAICAGIGISLLMWLSYLEYELFDLETIAYSFLGGVLGAMLGALILLVGDATWTPSPENSNIVYEGKYELVAFDKYFELNNGDNYVYFSQKDGESRYWNYIYKSEIGLQRQKTLAAWSYLNPIEEGETPSVQFFHWEHKNKIKRSLFCLTSDTRCTFNLPSDHTILEIDPQ